jgi:hypothetical protein
VTTAADASLYGRNLLTRRQLDIALEAADMEALAGDDDKDDDQVPQLNNTCSFVPRRAEASCASHARRAHALAQRLAELRRRGAASVPAARLVEARLLALGPAPTRAAAAIADSRRLALFEAAAARLESQADPLPIVEASLFLAGGGSDIFSACHSTYHARLLINGRLVGCTRELGVVGGEGGSGDGGGPSLPPPSLRPLPSLDWSEVFSVRLARWPESARLELWERRRQWGQEQGASATRPAWRRPAGAKDDDSLTLLLATVDLDVPESGRVATYRPYDWSGDNGAGAGAVSVRCAWSAERWQVGEGDVEEQEAPLPLPPPQPFSCFTNPLAEDGTSAEPSLAQPAPLAPPPPPPCWRPARRSVLQKSPAAPTTPRHRTRSLAFYSSSNLFVPPSRLAQVLKTAAIDPRDPSDRPLVELAILRQVLGPTGGGGDRRRRRRQGSGGNNAGPLDLLPVEEEDEVAGPSSAARLEFARRRWRDSGPFSPGAPSPQAAARLGSSAAPPPQPLELRRQQPAAAEAWALRRGGRRLPRRQEEEEVERQRNSASPAVRDPWASVPWWRPLSAGLEALVAAVGEPLRPLRGVRT